LSTFADVIPLHELPDRLASTSPHARNRPIACITIDDGYASACAIAVPILQRYAMPATFFVPTAYIESPTPLPFDRWGEHHRDRTTPETWRAATWHDLERAVAAGLVSIGSHSHTHPHGASCSPERLRDEAERSRECLRTRFGPDHARTYAYPYGNSRLGDVPEAYESAVRSAGYELAVTTDPGLAGVDSNPFRLPRLEVHQLDTASVLRAKVNGSLTPYRVIDRLRRPA
jgi:peptidoglycan/xylan/chitin deacetylase (PgdA/CDA1 family)